MSNTRRREGDLYKLTKAPYFGQEGEKAICTNSPRRLLNYEKARRRLNCTNSPRGKKTNKNESRRPKDFLLIIHKSDKMKDTCASKTIPIKLYTHLLSSGREDMKARSGISSSRLDDDEKIRRQDPESRQVDFVRRRRQEEKNMNLVESTSSGREDKKERSWISSNPLRQDEKTRRKDPESRQVDFFRTRRQEDKRPESCQVDLMRMRRQEDKILDLVKSTFSGRVDKKTMYLISSSRFHQDEKTRR